MTKPNGRAHFTPELFEFLRRLEQNNDREWFSDHKERYIDVVREPLLHFISDFGPRLSQISSQFVADPRPQGGSMFRIYRDTRFSKDKTPYKTAATARFPHRRGKNVHTPGFYLHLGLDGVFAGSGIWRPDSASLAGIRTAIVERPQDWKRVISGKPFKDGRLRLGGESLKRPPRGFDPDHPFIEDLKRKDFVAYFPFDEKTACSPDFLGLYVRACRSSAPFVRFLTEAIGVEW